MNGYHKYTPLRIALPFILGVVFSLNQGFILPAGHLLLIALVCLPGLMISYLFLKTNYNFRWVSGFLACVSLFFLGASMVSVIDQGCSNALTGKDATTGKAFLCRVEASPSARSSIYSGNALAVARLDSAGNWIPLKSKILVYFKNDSLCKDLSYGDLILISKTLQAIPGPPNPHMFSFSRYLHNHQIWHQVFLEQGDWKKVGRTDVNPLFFMAERCRKAFLETFREFGIVGQDFALVSALLLGNSEFLDAEIRQEFSYAGATHVLSVSGLHVGIVYVAADKMLFFLKRNRKSKKLHAVLTILCIWAYAIITGLSTSVVRASLMFSLIAAGNMLRRSSENYNILAVAAFLQLWINPFEITLVGFQLSYLAVLGIFAFYKPFNELVDSDNRLISWIWPVIAVSVAAQLATSPLASHYFNMFPVYFLLTNLIVVPLAGIIIYLAISLLVAGAVGLTFPWLAWPLKWSLQFMQGSVEMIQGWPGAVITPIVLSRLQVILIYLIIVSCFVFFILKYRKWAFVTLGSCICLFVIFAADLYKKLDTTEMTVYQVSGYTAIDLIHNRKAVFITDSLLVNDSKKINFQVKPNRMHKGVKELTTLITEDNGYLVLPGIYAEGPFIFFEGKEIVLFNENLIIRKTESRFDCDVLVISGKAVIKPEDLLTMLNVKQVVIDSSVPFYKADRLVGFFEREGIACHSVRHSGAYVVKW